LGWERVEGWGVRVAGFGLVGWSAGCGVED